MVLPVENSRSVNVLEIAMKNSPRCPWQPRCVLGYPVSGKIYLHACPHRLPKATCAWLHKQEGCVVICRLVHEGEVTCRRIARWLGCAGNKAKTARLRRKLKILAEYHILVTRKSLTGRKEALYRSITAGEIVVARCMTRLEEIFDDREQELRSNRAWNRVLLREIPKMKSLLSP